LLFRTEGKIEKQQIMGRLEQAGDAFGHDGDQIALRDNGDGGRKMRHDRNHVALPAQGVEALVYPAATARRRCHLHMTELQEGLHRQLTAGGGVVRRHDADPPLVEERRASVAGRKAVGRHDRHVDRSVVQVTLHQGLETAAIGLNSAGHVDDFNDELLRLCLHPLYKARNKDDREVIVHADAEGTPRARRIELAP